MPTTVNQSYTSARATSPTYTALKADYADYAHILLAAVGTDRRVVYDILATLQANRRVPYDILATLQTDRRMLYDILAAVPTSRRVLYDIIAPVQADRRVAYDILAAVSASRRAVYDILATLQVDVRVRYNIHQALDNVAIVAESAFTGAGGFRVNVAAVTASGESNATGAGVLIRKLSNVALTSQSAIGALFPALRLSPVSADASGASSFAAAAHRIIGPGLLQVSGESDLGFQIIGHPLGPLSDIDSAAGSAMVGFGTLGLARVSADVDGGSELVSTSGINFPWLDAAFEAASEFEGFGRLTVLYLAESNIAAHYPVIFTTTQVRAGNPMTTTTKEKGS